MADDYDRLIQEVLAELGRDADPRQIAQQVRRLDLGLPAEDEFVAVCSWLGKTRLIENGGAKLGHGSGGIVLLRAA